MDGFRFSSFAVVAMACLLAACSVHDAWRGDGVRAKARPTETGAEVAEHLQRRFDAKLDDCGSATRPAFLCSGILMRSTEYSATYHSWIPNPNTAPWGISFSWLRQDSDFDENYPSDNGFIVYPRFYADDGNYDLLTVRCAFPFDAWTGAPDRCNTSGHPGLCQKHGVTNAFQWIAKYTDNSNQCAFDVNPSAPDTAFAWTQMVTVRQLKNSFDRNEIILAAWAQNTHARMPLEAFFYRTNGVGSALNDARSDQRDFRAAAGRWVPIIRWTPTVGAARATFTYNVADQAILN